MLVVDDEEAVRRLACRMLTWTGYQALEARHGREALATIEERWPGKPILYMSGFASEVFRGGLLEPGAPFLAKPFTQDDLAAKVRDLLEKAQ